MYAELQQGLSLQPLHLAESQRQAEEGKESEWDLRAAWWRLLAWGAWRPADQKGSSCVMGQGACVPFSVVPSWKQGQNLGKLSVSGHGLSLKIAIWPLVSLT